MSRTHSKLVVHQYQKNLGATSQSPTFRKTEQHDGVSDQVQGAYYTNQQNGQDSKAKGNMNITEYLQKEKQHHSEHSNILPAPSITRTSDRNRKTSEGPRKVAKLHTSGINLINQNSNQKIKQINTRVLLNERSELSQSFFSSAQAENRSENIYSADHPQDKTFYSTGVIPTK